MQFAEEEKKALLWDSLKAYYLSEHNQEVLNKMTELEREFDLTEDTVSNLLDLDLESLEDELENTKKFLSEILDVSGASEQDKNELFNLINK